MPTIPTGLAIATRGRFPTVGLGIATRGHLIGGAAAHLGGPPLGPPGRGGGVEGKRDGGIDGQRGGGIFGVRKGF